MDNRPIGVFDSGVGGLSVLKEIRKVLPKENIIYFGDTARVPYGTRSKDTVIKYTLECAKFLVQNDVKAIVIACNTASAIALTELTKEYDIPIIGVIKPGSVAASKKTKNKKIGVIGTPATIKSRAYDINIKKLDESIHIYAVACPLFVPLVEEGWQNTEISYLTAKEYFKSFLDSNIDSLVLGCTHYPAMEQTIKKILPNVNLVNPAYETAKYLKELLENKDMLSKNNDSKEIFYVSDDEEKFKITGKHLLGSEIKNIKKIDLSEAL